MDCTLLPHPPMGLRKLTNVTKRDSTAVILRRCCMSDRYYGPGIQFSLATRRVYCSHRLLFPDSPSYHPDVRHIQDIIIYIYIGQQYITVQHSTPVQWDQRRRLDPAHHTQEQLVLRSRKSEHGLYGVQGGVLYRLHPRRGHGTSLPVLQESVRGYTAQVAASL